MESKSLLIGIISFIAGALLVSTAATTFDKPKTKPNPDSSMVELLKNKSGDNFDESFIAGMIVHHEDAVAMAKLSARHAKHDEIKKLSEAIISAQEQEIKQMKDWQNMWGYKSATPAHQSH